MEKITLLDTLPAVFADQPQRHSDLWRHNITFQRGHSYLISAESGAGKSSLCAYIFGFRRDYLGQILFDGTDSRKLSIAQWCRIRQKHIAYLPQELRLFPELTALENVELKNRQTGYKSRQQILSLFDAMGIADRADSLAGQISIGQQQRVAIIRTLCQPCDFILLDEPVSHLDQANNSIVASIIQSEALSSGAGIIATSVGNNIELNATEGLNL